MKKHKLLLFELISRRLRGKLLLLLVLVVAAAIYDIYTQFLGDYWYVAWVVAGLLIPLWFYYAILFRRGAIHIRADVLRLQGPIWRMNIPYEDIYSVTAGQMEQHYPFSSLSWAKRGLLSPLYGASGVFVELKTQPKGYDWRHLWFPPYIFGKNRGGLLLYGGDWMITSGDIEAARAQWLAKHGQHARRGQTSAERLGRE